MTSNLIQFTPFSSIVQPAFWQELTKLKIDVLRLSQDSVPVWGYYGLGRTVHDRETGTDVALGCTLVVGADAFGKEEDLRPPPHSVPVRGTLKNFNTIDEFKAVDKKELFNSTAKELWEDMQKDPSSSSSTTHFLLITFADLKKYKYHYWFAFPAFTAAPPWTRSGSVGPVGDVIPAKGLESIYKAIHSTGDRLYAGILAKPSANDPQVYETASLSAYREFFAGTSAGQRFLVFSDPSAHPQHLGWPLRNILAYILHNHPQLAPTSQGEALTVVSWRDEHLSPTPKSVYTRVFTPSAPTKATPDAVGWEKNANGRLGPRMADLAPMMDPKRLADQAVDLNLKLMRWRILPELELEKVSQLKCLLLGAGTLGCYVARTLMGWGVRKITFVDSGRVSFSNPVRQPLFEFADCLEGGKPKAKTAAEMLKKIFPGVDAQGHEFLIPMPGHPIPPQSLEQTKKDVKQLEDLIEEHDVVFLLMDSRESRWLPTVVGAAKGKIVMNVALGFDTYLVMRHGTRAKLTPEGVTRLGCYYCNDIVAPADSLKDQTLDQMCTVTRPGLASIASSTAVELLVSMLQHPQGVHAPPPPPTGGTASEGVLGIVPHQMRGYLARFNNMLITGAAFDNCTGCSEAVLETYEKEGFDMMLKAFNEIGYLEKLSGLDKLHKESEAAMEAVDWDEEDDDM